MLPGTALITDHGFMNQQEKLAEILAHIDSEPPG